jgi:hypothetical protein
MGMDGFMLMICGCGEEEFKKESFRLTGYNMEGVLEERKDFGGGWVTARIEWEKIAHILV